MYVLLAEKEKRIKSVLSAIKKHKKILSVVEEILVLSKMLNVEVLGRTHGELIYNGETITEVVYELIFYVEKDGRKFEEKIVFSYRQNTLYSVETFIYPFDLQKTLNKSEFVDLLNDFKKIFY
jgi:hypothetical protein